MDLPRLAFVAEVGIRDSAIYHYFSSKEALFEAIIAKRAESAQGDSSQALLDEPIEDVRAFLEALARTSAEHIQTARAQKRFRILMSDGPRLQAEGKLNVLDNIALLQSFAKIMQRLVREKHLRSANPELLAVEFASPFLMLMMMRILQPSHPIAKNTASFYTITGVEGACFVLAGEGGQQIHLVRSSGGLHLQQIRLHARSIQEREASMLAMCFEPPLPLGSSLSEGDLQEVGFRISIDDEGDLITGTVRAHRTQGEVHLLLAPEEPAWSAQRRVSIRIAEADPRSFTIDTEIVPPP